MSFYSFSITSLLVIIVSLTCRSLSSVPLNRPASAESFIQNTEEFIPTNEWQIVKEGQAIPPGLHVRLNLETGLREAKLLDDDQPAPSNDLVPVPKDEQEEEQEQTSRRRLEQAFANLNLSRDDVVSDPSHDEQVKTKFRPYDELKKDFEAMNMNIQTDLEILTGLMKKLGETDDEATRQTILTDLEYYLHQYDNAILFADMHGLELLLRLLNATDANREIRHLTSLALGAAFQGNPQVQAKGLELGFVQYLLRSIKSESDENMKFRLLFTLSTLLRNHPQGQKNFLEHGGIETCIQVYDQIIHTNEKIRQRIMDLMTDLITEKEQEKNDEQHTYDNIDIRDQLIKHHWCARLSQRLRSLTSGNDEQIEKTVLAMMPLTDLCRTDFLPLLSLLDGLHDHDDSTAIANLREKLTLLSSSDL